jgi:hypothetical protein
MRQPFLGKADWGRIDEKGPKAKTKTKEEKMAKKEMTKGESKN